MLSLEFTVLAFEYCLEKLHVFDRIIVALVILICILVHLLYSQTKVLLQVVEELLGLFTIFFDEMENVIKFLSLFTWAFLLISFQ